jgi:transcriptional regulator with PAS, ATPase and Fis domain
MSGKDCLLVGGLQTDRLAMKLSKVAGSELTILALGESGTGKEVVAREVHRQSGRSGRFCAVNCAAIPQQLLESELFGYRKGAFSGATQDKPGLFQLARGGTLLLDEIGDMPAESQAKLLRVLQERQVTPLGGLEPEAVDVRIVAATHQDLEKLQEDGTFRRDLYARLGEFVVYLLPLRDRKEDIMALTRVFLRDQNAENMEMSVGFAAALLHHDWPYNVRELESCIKRCVTLADGNRLRRKHLPESVLESCADYGRTDESAPPPLPRNKSTLPPIDGPNEDDLRGLLMIHRGNITAIARELGKARMQVHRWMARYSIDPEEYRKPGESE